MGLRGADSRHPFFHLLLPMLSSAVWELLIPEHREQSFAETKFSAFPTVEIANRSPCSACLSVLSGIPNIYHPTPSRHRQGLAIGLWVLGF